MTLLVGCGPWVGQHLSALRALQATGRYAETIEPLREIVSKEPDNPEANYLLGVGLLETGQRAEAVPSLRRSAATDAYGIEAGILLASALMADRAYEQAVAAADSVIKRDPSRLTAWVVRAQAQLQSGDFEAALAGAEKLDQLQPAGVAGDLIRVAALVRLGRIEEAERTYRSIATKAKANGELGLAARACAECATMIQQQRGDTVRAEKTISGCVEEYPTDPGVLQTASDLYASQGEASLGTKLWRGAIEHAPQSVSLRIGLAQALAREGSTDDAEATLKALTQEQSDSFEAWKALIDLQRARGAFDRALASIDAGLSKLGADQRLLFERGDLLLARGDLASAEAIGGSLPEGPYRDLLQGQIFLARQQYVQALDAIQRGLSRWPGNVEAHVVAARAAEHTGDHDRAGVEYRTALRLDPSNADARLALARMLLGDGRSAEAADLISPLTQAKSVRRAEALRVLAAAREKAGDTKGAWQAATALRAIPGSEAAGWLALASIERRRAGPVAVARLLERADLDYTDPSNAPALQALVSALLETDRREEALARVDRTLGLHPDAPGLLVLQGAVRLKLGELDPARQAFLRALALDLNYVPAVTGLATLESLTGDRLRAIELFDWANMLDPMDGTSAYSAAQLVLALGQRREAEQRLRAIVQRYPEVLDAANDLAFLLADRGSDLDFALRLAERAVGSDPSATVLDTLGYVHLKRGEPEQAAQAFRHALEKNPDSASTLYHLGLALKAAGNRDDARSAFAKALGRGAFPEREAAEAELARREIGESEQGAEH